jgi:hypothetical protein
VPMREAAPIRRLEIIRRHNFESRCIIELRRIAGFGTFNRRRRPVHLVDIIWHDTNPPLQADYELTVGAQTVKVRFARGVWIGSTYSPHAARLKKHPQAALDTSRTASTEVA